DKKQQNYQTIDHKLEELESKRIKDGNVMRYYKNNNYVLYRKYYDNSNIVQLEDFMSSISKKRLERCEYNEFGQLHRKIYYTHKPFSKLCEVYFDTKGHIYCKKYF